MTVRPASWAEDFHAFLEEEGSPPPRRLEEPLRATIHRDLHPRLSRTLLKISGMHIFMGTPTLLFCSQFGLSIGGGGGLADFFMRFGHGFCMAACGVTFIGGTALAASALLTVEETRRLRRQALWPWLGLSALSLAALHFFGALVLEAYALIWLAAAALAGSGFLEAGWRVRLLLRERRAL